MPKINIGSLGKDEYSAVEVAPRGRKEPLVSVAQVIEQMKSGAVCKLEFHTNKKSKTTSSLNSTTLYRLIGDVEGFHVAVLIHGVRFMLISKKVPATLKHLSWKTNQPTDDVTSVIDAGTENPSVA